jgi:hypothetical protein
VSYARHPFGDVGTSRIGDGARLSSATGVIRSDASSSSDADDAGRRAGVEAPAPLPASQGAVGSPWWRRRGAWLPAFVDDFRQFSVKLLCCCC